MNERRIFAEKKPEQSFDLDAAYKLAVKALDIDAIDMKSFAGLYSKEAIEDDQAYVARRERQFKRGDLPGGERSRQRARVLEAIIHHHGEVSEWFGPEAFTFRASRYDDIRNGVDEIVEFRGEGRGPTHLALAIDATSTHDNCLEEKLGKILNEVRRGTLTEVKYFASEYHGFQGRLSRVPRTVVGADVDTIEEIGALWLSGDNRALATHHIQLQVLGEIRMQLEVFAAYAREEGEDDAERACRERLEIIEGIVKEKGSLFEDVGVIRERIEKDRVFRTIRDKLWYVVKMKLQKPDEDRFRCVLFGE